jgi:competence protein ComEC
VVYFPRGSSYLEGGIRVKVHQINVGQGHTTFIELDDGFRIVIDADTWDCVVNPIDYLIDLIPPDSGGDRRIDLLVVTHPHRDHASGVTGLLEAFEVAEIWESGHRLECDEDWYEELIAALENADAEVVSCSAEPIRTTNGGAEIRIFAPTEATSVDRPGDQDQRRHIHDQCAVVSVREGDESFLILGDSRWNEWKNRIVEEYGEDALSHNLLLASHHGSRTFFRDDEEDEPFLDGLRSISPKVVLVSVGDNDFGHPHEDALELYAQESEAVLRTDELGTLIASTDGAGWTVEALGDLDGEPADNPQEVYAESRGSILKDVAAVGVGVAVGALAGGAIRQLQSRVAEHRPRPRHWGV